jgi:peptide/nickel transport system substrate-binding protein
LKNTGGAAAQRRDTLVTKATTMWTRSPARKPDISARRGRRLRQARAVAAALALLALATACRWAGREPPLVVAFGEDPVQLDPHRGNRNAGWSVLSSICDGLVAFAPDMTLEPALAERWEQIGPREWHFHLRRGVWFHNGAALTAADVVASLERARTHPRSSVAYHMVGVSSVAAEGDRTVVVTTVGAAPDLLNRLTFVLVVPREQAAEQQITAPVGTGSYRFIRSDADGTVVARAWSGWRGRPPITEVRFEFHDSDGEAARRLAAGEADICNRVPDDWLNELGAAAGVRLVQQPGLAVHLLGVHPELATGVARAALADARVRHALLLALDRSAWIRRLQRGNGAVATQYVHPAVFGFDPELEALPYDPDKARRLLAEAGYAGGFAVELEPGSASADLVAAIVDDLAAVGVRARSLEGKSGPLTYFAWACSTGDASDFLNSPLWHAPDRAHALPGTPSLEADVLPLLAAAGGEVDPFRRRALLQQAQRRVLEALPLLPLTVRWGYRGVSDRVEVVTRYDERLAVATCRLRR